jgi:hypothetical protein
MSPGTPTVNCKSINDVKVIFNDARFGVLTAVVPSILLFGAVIPCRLVNREFPEIRGAVIFRVKQHYQ